MIEQLLLILQDKSVFGLIQLQQLIDAHGEQAIIKAMEEHNAG